MKKIASVIIGVIISMIFCFNVNARELDGLEKRQLILLVKDINSKVREKDFSVLVNSMPARLYKAMAIKMNTTEAVLRASFQEQLTAQFDILIPNGYRLDDVHIDYKETPGGGLYALIPTQIETSSEVIQSTTLAIYDNLRWNIVLGGQKTVQNPVFLEIYPGFQNIGIAIGAVVKK